MTQYQPSKTLAYINPEVFQLQKRKVKTLVMSGNIKAKNRLTFQFVRRFHIWESERNLPFQHHPAIAGCLSRNFKCPEIGAFFFIFSIPVILVV